MKIAIVGTGYVGLVTGTCFAEMGNHVVCVDTDTRKVEKLRQGIMPIFEAGLESLVVKNANEGRLVFSMDLPQQLQNGISMIFCAVGTPPQEDGSADLSYVFEVARTVGEHATDYFVFVTKSTVPIGTTGKVRQIIQEKLNERGVTISFDVASNPEFLKQGAAIKDFMSPDRVVVGVESERAKELMTQLYRPFLLNNFRVIFMDIPSAEMTKYASNAMLATRISFMNEIANLCERIGADAEMVRNGVGSDKRIGHYFLYPGTGYGGSCFPKDVKALSHIGRQNGYPMQLIEAVDEVNERQKSVLFDKLSADFNGNLKGRTIALWGLAFKPETDDMRGAPSLVIVEKLIEAGAIVRGFDPVAMEEAQRRLGDRITYCKDLYDAATGADAALLVTEWKQFRMPDWNRVQSLMAGSLILDGRNIYDWEELQRHGFRYIRIGKIMPASI